MKRAFLLTWNAERWPWHELSETAARVHAGEIVTDRWNCGKTRRIVVGDRVFILKQGKEPRGIIGSGWVTTAVFTDLHWDETKRSLGVSTNYILFTYDKLFDPQVEAILDRDFLKETPGLAQGHWDPRGSGMQIKKEILPALEVAWSQLEY